MFVLHLVIEIQRIDFVGLNRAKPSFEIRATATHFARLPSLEGHDSFLIDIPRFGSELRSFLD